MSRIAHHQIDKDREKAPQDGSTVPDLIAIHGAVPRRTTVNELVTQDVEPVEQDREDPRRILGFHRMAACMPGPFEFLSPVLIASNTVVMLPEWSEHIAVIQKNADLLAETLPNHVVDPAACIEPHHDFEEDSKVIALSRFIEIARIGCIEADPEEDEANVEVFMFILSPRQPTEGSMDAQGQSCRETIPQIPLLALETGWMKR